MAKQYPLKVENVGNDTYQVMSKGHHEPLSFMVAVRAAGYDWPLGQPSHVYFKAFPNGRGETSYSYASQETSGAFPATITVEAYGSDRFADMIQWNGNNLHDVIEFTGKSERFNEWFATWDDYVAHVKSEGNIFKLIKPEGGELAKVGDWIFKDENGLNHVLSVN